MNGKKRTKNQILGEKGVKIIEEYLPLGWLCREMTPDYGIDLEVETFEEMNNGDFITTGEHMYIQVKCSKEIPITKSAINEYKDNSCNKYKRIEVVTYDIDTDLLATVEKMGAAVPVLLAYVEECTKKIYYICLNDYIEKCIYLKYIDYKQQKTVRVVIPVENVITCTDDMYILEYYSKRAKLYALFSKVRYQLNNMNYFSNEELLKKSKQYAKLLLKSDAWSAKRFIPNLEDYYEQLQELISSDLYLDDPHKRMLERAKEVGEDIYAKEYETGTGDPELASLIESYSIASIKLLWENMTVQADIYEDDCRNFLQPTYFNEIEKEL